MKDERGAPTSVGDLKQAGGEDDGGRMNLPPAMRGGIKGGGSGTDIPVCP